jgi:hypothetical protein
MILQFERITANVKNSKAINTPNVKIVAASADSTYCVLGRITRVKSSPNP